MKNLEAIAVALLLSTRFVLAGEAAPPDFIFKKTGETLTLLPPASHHFNKDAPNRITSAGKTLKAKVGEKQITVSGPMGPSVEATAYLCDDAKTYCVKKVQKFEGVSSSPDSQAAAAKSARKPKSGLEKETGFWLNAPERAFAQAKAENKPLMIDFFGIWCPPCNHLDAMVFRSKEFRTKTEPAFIKLKLDADEELSNPYKNRYLIRGLPTVIFATPEGDEITRVVGYRAPFEMLKKAEFASANRMEGSEAITAKAKAGDKEAQYRAATLALERNDAKLALQWLTPLKARYLESKSPRLESVYKAEALGATEKADKEKVLTTWIEAFPSSIDALDAHDQLAELQEELGKKDASVATLLKFRKAIDTHLARPAAELVQTDYTPADLHQLKADVLKRLGETELAKAEFETCAKAYEEEAKAEGGEFPRGPNLERAYCLSQGGKLDESERLYREGARRFPGEYTFHYQLARFLIDSRKDAHASLKEISRALRQAYGPQRLKATLVEVKALEAEKKWKEAVRALDRELSVPLPEDATAGTRSLRERLGAKKQELEKKL